MKQVETIKAGENFTAVNVGKLSSIKDYVLPLGDIEIPGKVFVGQALQATGSELSFQTLFPGQDSGFLHTHKTHEELYFILKGEGEYQVDGEIFPVSEGSIIRVAPAGKRALKNTGKDEMLMLCIQYKANSFTENDSPAGDGVHILGKKNSATLEELLQEMEDRTPKEVETALCKLTADGIIKQSAKSFSLTDRGLSLLPLAENLAHWCEQNFCSKQF